MDGVSRVGHGAPQLVLASASARRRDILRSLGVEPVIAPASIDESPLDGEKPAELVERLARTKAEVVAAGRTGDVGRSGADRQLVVGADTVIDLDGTALGKPTDRDEAEWMLRAMSGREHSVVTGVAVVGPADDRSVTVSTVARTGVSMRPLTQPDLDWYLDSGEYEGKAGAYAIQGLGSLLVDGIDGSYHNVVGLPVVGLDGLLEEVGFRLRDLVST